MGKKYAKDNAADLPPEPPHVVSPTAIAHSFSSSFSEKSSDDVVVASAPAPVKPPGQNVQLLIDNFGLQPHPEGGWFAETYRGADHVTTSSGARRASSTAIYFLICPGNVSRLHRIASDEVWHFYLGGPLAVVEVGNEAEFGPAHHKATILGQDIAHGQMVQYTVKAGTWFGCYPLEHEQDAGGDGEGSKEVYSFVGCTVAPGFEFSDFELASRAALLAEFPQAHEVIVKLTEGLP